MLHPIPKSTERQHLLAVLALQCRLIKALCRLPYRTKVNQEWLEKTVWPKMPKSWVNRFWKNDKGQRANWIAIIAKASKAEKQMILRMMHEQLRFLELYTNPPTIRLTYHTWNSKVMEAVNKLLVAFYAPLFYKDEGFPYRDEGFPVPSSKTLFHKDHFIAGFNRSPKICPYTDNKPQDIKLDHFLPKDHFPMLSCHPDNLIPCSTDPNSVSHKGTKIPLDLASNDQANEWFHPLKRCAEGKYTLVFNGSSKNLSFHFHAHDLSDQPRLENMNRMFGLTEFWSRDLDDELQSIASRVADILRNYNPNPSVADIINEVKKEARRTKNRIGRDTLAIVKSHFYDHIANTQTLLDQVVRTCKKGT
jgi:hypothetical protein